MSTPILIPFQNDVSAMKEAMLLAGQKLRIGMWRRGAMGLITTLSFVFMAAGGAAVAAFVTILMSEEPALMWPSILGGAFGATLAIRWYDRLVSIMAAAVLETPFNLGAQELRIDDRGVRLTNPQAEWFTAWSGIHEVALGAQGLAFMMSGIALYAPLAALPEDRDGMMAQIESWRAAARGPDAP